MSLEEQSEMINIGTIVESGEDFGLEIDEIDNNLFMCGLPNMGQEDFISNFFINYNALFTDPVLIFRFDSKFHELQDQIENLIILKPGINFSLDIFDTMGIDPFIHAGKLLEWFKLLDIMNNNAVIEKLIFEILVKICKHQEFHNWNTFLELIEEKLTQQGLNDVIIDIQNKLRKFTTGQYKGVFQKHEYYETRDLFETIVLLDLSPLIQSSGKIDDLLLIVDLILKILQEHTGFKAKKNDTGLTHITYFQYKEMFDSSTITKHCIEELGLICEQASEMMILDVPQVNDNTKNLLRHCSSVACFRLISEDILLDNLSFTFSYDVDFSNLIFGRCVFKSNLMNYPVLVDVTELNIVCDFSEIDENALDLLDFIDEELDY